MKRGLGCFLLATLGCVAAPVPDAAKLLLHPEAMVSGQAATGPGVTLAPSVDGTPLSFAQPRLLFQQSTAAADFVAAAWDDAAGHLVHQREVLFVKPSYVVVVDHVYGSGLHRVTRFWKAGDRGGLHMISSVPPDAEDLAPGGPGTTSFTTTAKLPAPFTAILFKTSLAAPLQAELVKAHNPMVVKYKVTYPDGRTDEGGLAWESRPLHLSTPEIPLAGWAAWVRKQAGQVTTFEIK